MSGKLSAKQPVDFQYHGNGFKSRWFGTPYWTCFHRLAQASCPSPDVHGSFRPHSCGLPTKASTQLKQDLYTSLQHLLPCVHCRNSYKEFLEVPGHKLQDYSDNLVEWSWKMQNFVNKKLEKPEIPFRSDDPCHSVGWRPDQGEAFVKAFFAFVFSIALNYPKAWQWTPGRPSPESLNSKDQERFKAYSTFFPKLAAVLPCSNQFCNDWRKAYRRCPPSPLSFSSRYLLVQWVHQVAVDSGWWKYSLEETISNYEAFRAQSCAGEKSCE